MTHKMLAKKVPIQSMKTPPFQLVAIVLLLWFCFTAPTVCLAAEKLQPSPEDRCAVCGMMVLPHPNWVAQVAFKDGTNRFFDGPRDMFIFLFDLEKYQPGSKTDDIESVFVTEYYTVQRYDAHEVFFVSGSDVLGPMGAELVPVAELKNLKVFVHDHKHEKIMRFDGENLSEVYPLQ